MNPEKEGRFSIVIRYVRPAARASATAVAAAAGLMVLASTGQSPSGFVPASIGGPLGLFDSSAVTAMDDVVTIGDGATDAKELASLLESAGPITSSPSGPVQATFSPGALPNTTELSVTPAPGVTSAPAHEQSLSLTPVLDSQGKLDCSKAVSCKTDPKTKITTVTYPDGVVAFVQQINELTLVAYKAVGEVIHNSLGALLPKDLAPLPAAAQAPATTAPPTVMAAPAPTVKVAPVAPVAPTVKAEIPKVDTQVDTTPASTGPVAPSAPAAPDISASTIRPQLTISDPPKDFEADKSESDGATSPKPVGTLGAVKDAVGSVVDAVTGAVGKAIGPGAVTEKTDPSASTNTKSETKSGKGSDSGSDDGN